MNSTMKKHELKGVEETGRDLLQSSYYAKQTELAHKGLKCVARTINPELLRAITGGGRDGGGEKVELIYESHCTQLLELRHPHLLQFIGIRYEQSQLSFVMEQLPLCLSDALDRYGKLSDEISYSILRDVALGMVYLHSRSPSPVVHGELTASNVYLTTDMTAKIADVGVSTLLNLTPSRRKAIGYKALVHLPPESLALPSNDRSPSRAAQVLLNKKLDSYSFGVLMVHTLSAKFPDYIARRAHRFCGAVLNLSADTNGVDEVLGEVHADHPLSSLILQCINQMADLRPELSQILSTLMEMMLQFPAPSIGRRLEVLQRIFQASSQKKPNYSYDRSRPLRKDSIANMANSLEIEHLKLQIEELHVENRGLRMSLTKQREIVNARDHEMAAKLMAKDQEIISKQQELSAQETMVDAYKATITAKEGTLSVLTNHMQHLQSYITSKHEPHLLFPKAQLKWRQCSHLPQAMIFAQAITIGEYVYFGSGASTITDPESVHYKIYKYNSTKDKWGPVSCCPVIGFGIVNFEDHLCLVGGAYESQDDSGLPYVLTNDVYVYNDDCSACEKSIPSMPTARLLPTAFTFGSTIVACGGIILDEKNDTCVSTVEVYSHLKSQWYCAEPIPFPCVGMSFSSIQDISYFMGGFTDTEFDHPTKGVFSVCMPQLIEAALIQSTDTNGSANSDNPKGSKLWQKFPDAPRYASSLTTIGGCLVAIGGSDEHLEHKSGALHVYSPLTTSWLRLDDIPVACFACIVSRLPKGELLIIGGMGHDEDDALKTVYRGRICLD